jgi:hypothetical protein
MEQISLREVTWINDSAESFSTWLAEDGRVLTRGDFSLPNIYRWTVSTIAYEGLYEWLWDQKWFQDGMRAFALLALEREGNVTFLAKASGELFVRTPDGAVYTIESFLTGESLTYKYDPEFSDMSWDPVQSASRVMEEYGRKDDFEAS